MENILIVEGKEDQSLICALLKKIKGADVKSNNPKEVLINSKPFAFIHDAGNIDNAKKIFKQYIKERDHAKQAT